MAWSIDNRTMTAHSAGHPQVDLVERTVEQCTERPITLFTRCPAIGGAMVTHILPAAVDRLRRWEAAILQRAIYQSIGVGARDGLPNGKLREFAAGGRDAVGRARFQVVPS